MQLYYHPVTLEELMLWHFPGKGSAAIHIYLGPLGWVFYVVNEEQSDLIRDRTGAVCVCALYILTSVSAAHSNISCYYFTNNFLIAIQGNRNIYDA